MAPCLVPGAAALSGDEMQRLLDLVDEALDERTPALRRQFSLLLSVLRWAPAAQFGRPLERLPRDTQATVLRWFQDAPLQTLRGGFWGFRTLVFLGYYGRPEAREALGYRPTLDGNAILHDRARR
jgi:hypothetical protein